MNLQLRKYLNFFPAPLIFISLILLHSMMQNQIIKNQKAMDSLALLSILDEVSFDNNPLDDTVLLSVDSNSEEWVDFSLLALTQDRLAYIARNQGEVSAVVVPATADTGFNDTVDLLVAVDMYGRIKAARVLAPNSSNSLYGVLEIIQSEWIKLFSNNTFRDIQRLSWQKIGSNNEYDLFVGASVTPKTVSAKIYDTLVFIQSNRIALIREHNT